MRLVIRAVLLTLVPLAVMTAIGLSLISRGDGPEGRSTIAVGVILAATMGASVIYQVRQWSLRTQSLAHFGVMAATVLPALLLSGWFPLHTVWGYLVVIGLFLLTGAILWTTFYLIFTRTSARSAPEETPTRT